MHTRKVLALATLALAALALSCGGAIQPSPTAAATSPAATPTPNPWAAIPQIVDPANHGWPRVVKGATGPVELKRKPERILTLSLGHDEMSLALVPPSRLAGTSEFATNPGISNIVERARGIPALPRNAEAVIAARPDLVVVSPFSRKELIQQLTDAGLPVFQTERPANPLYYERDLLLLAYLYGEEEKAQGVLRTIRARRERIDAVVAKKSPGERPSVLALSGGNFTGGRGTTNDAIIEAAGGLNAAARAGIDGFKQLSLEIILQLDPDYILTPGDDPANPQVRNELLHHPALQGLRALKEPQERLLAVPNRYLSTLSFWNVRGIEELARALWPQDFASVEFPAFDFQP
ncbi:MAG: ABC transporter substrate-binding protein [Dehalococcoidia bacterium]|nr:ABC transporter substrate-binding protein [Dehalococcoidia bacterium]